MQKWEYVEVVVHFLPDGKLDFISENGKTVPFENEIPNRHHYLNKLGREGWDLVTVYPSTGWTEIYHFKRPVGESGRLS